MNATDTANLLALTGIGIGLTEIAAPGVVERSLGIGNHHRLLRTMGMREIASGLTILNQDQPASGVWSRVAGDVLDLALLGVAAVRSNKKMFVLGAVAAVLAVSYMDLKNARELTR